MLRIKDIKWESLSQQRRQGPPLFLSQRVLLQLHPVTVNDTMLHDDFKPDHVT